MQSRARLRAIAGVVLATLLPGCERKSEPPPATASAPATPKPAPAPKPPPPPQFTDAEAAEVVVALDSSRITSAYTVRGLSESESILEFGRVMVMDHRAASQLIDSVMTASGKTPADNATSQQVRQEAQQFVTELMSRQSGINDAYVSREVRDHEHLLMLLDTALIPSAQNAGLRTALEQLRPMVEAHLQQVKRIAAARAAAAAARAQAAGPTVPPAATPTVRPDTQRRPAVRPASTTNM